MSFRWLFGFLNFAVVFATMSPARQSLMKLQKSASTDCAGTDCTVDHPPANHSALEPREARCECCWRDCNLDSPEHKEFPAFAKSIAGDGEDLADVDAWLIMCHGKMQHSLDLNMYTPILETVKIGVESKGGKAQVIGLADMRAMQTAIKAAVAAGRRPMVFAVAYWYAPLEQEVFQGVKVAREAGAYTILYQSEQMPHGKKLQRSIGSATMANAHEVWEYSRANLAHYPSPEEVGFIARYVPPGYVKSMDAGVDLNSPLKQQQYVGYMGGAGKPMAKTYVDMFGGINGHLQMSNHIWTDAQLKEFLEKYPLQLNQHKDQYYPQEEWEAEWQHFETFRMTSLLSNKACVISAPSADVEMKQWGGIINFVEVPNTVKKAKELWQNLDKCRIKSYETFKRDYAPLVLLQQSGFFDVWSPGMRPQ